MPCALVSGFILWDNTFPNLISWHWYTSFLTPRYGDQNIGQSQIMTYWWYQNEKMLKWNSDLLWFQRCLVDRCCLQPPWCPVKQITERLGHTKREGVCLSRASVKLCEELLTCTVLGRDQTAHLGAWNPLLPFRTWRSWWTLLGRVENVRGHERQMNGFKDIMGRRWEVFSTPFLYFRCSTGWV